jgi:hypothetical protein
MRGILLLVAALAACKDKRAQPPPARAKAAVPSPRPAGPAPTLPPDKPVTHMLEREAFMWSFAEARNTAAGWDAAATAFEQELASCDANCAETAYAILLARKNALLVEPIKPPPGEEPLDLPPRVQAALDASDQYVALGDPDDHDVKGSRFIAASLTYRWRQPDAIDRLIEILKFHRDHPTAEYAANQLLDLLMRADRGDELRQWVGVLLADATFLADKPELRTTLERLRDMFAAQ